jgi:tripeptide aminopeptidase
MPRQAASAAERKRRARPIAGPPQTGEPVEPNAGRAFDLVMRLMAIPGKSGQERQAAEFVAGQLQNAGVAASAILRDDAHRRTPLLGEVGNLALHLPGTFRGPRRLLMAHLDTVPLCVGSMPRREGDFVRSADPRTALGADDRAGAAAVLSAALEIIERSLPHPPVTFLWTVQEEVGLFGARHVRRSLLGKPRLAFNFDGGSPYKVTVGATGGYRMTIEVRGIASHAGGAPERGVSAIAVAALAIADLHRGGWHGDIRKGNRHGTSNVGIIQGGDATNVVTDRVFIRAEARSHDPAFRLKIAAAIEKAFQNAAREVKNVEGKCGEARIEGRLDYESFRLKDDEPCVRAAEAAVRAIGRRPERAVTNGGLDANWITAHGVPTVTLGCGQLGQHMTSEALDVPAFRDACRIALRLATATEGA